MKAMYGDNIVSLQRTSFSKSQLWSIQQTFDSDAGDSINRCWSYLAAHGVGHAGGGGETGRHGRQRARVEQEPAGRLCVALGV